MKIALVFNGILRSIQYTIDNLNEYIFQQLKNENIEYDIYCHNFNLKTYNNSRNNETDIELLPENYLLLPAKYYIQDEQNDIKNNIDFKKYFVNGHKWENNNETAQNYILSLWSKNKITDELIKNINNGEKYDYIIYIRSDVIFHNNINFTKLFSKIKNDNDCIIPDFHHFFGFNDRMFIAKPKLGIYYGKYFEHIHKIINEGKPLHSELYNLLLLYKYKANVIKEPIYFSRMRSNGKMKKEDFTI
jgi:hypothetical protein